ncbi:type II toxin-antitoxin system VapC family toxin [bacterium]|nr:type II toxin-antitoxin system VapC family toxin [bacterium]
MKYLSDTHALLWIVDRNSQLSNTAREIYLDEDNEILISSASIWEMAIKISLKRLIIPGNLQEFVKEHVIGNNIQILNISLSHIYRLETLQYHHRDPFDRLLISQAIEENIPIISSDNRFDQYGVNRIW